MVVEFTAIVGLECEHAAPELCESVCMKMFDCGSDIRLGTEGEGPNKVGEIIKQGKIVLITCEARHRRGPHIAINKLKWS